MDEKIYILPSSTADTRTCDWSKVSEEQLLAASRQHIGDVQRGMDLLARLLGLAAASHDRTKISHASEFWRDFNTGFKRTEWWEMHQKEERHHFNNPEHIQDDINLLDVLEQIVDGVMAGMARSGKYRCEPLPDALLQKAYANTAKLLLSVVQVCTPAFLRGRLDCAQDRCENVPFGSVGGLDCRQDMRLPQYVQLAEAEQYLAGYRSAAEEIFGRDWATREFSWKPALTVGEQPARTAGEVCRWHRPFKRFACGYRGDAMMDDGTCPGCGRRVEVR